LVSSLLVAVVTANLSLLEIIHENCIRTRRRVS
jgi:hypothetical protein